MKRFLFASDFDKTLTFNDTGYVLSELLGIATEDFERKVKGMASLNLVQQGAELSCLLLHDPQFRTRCAGNTSSKWASESASRQYQTAPGNSRPSNRGVPIRILCTLSGPGGSDPIGA